MKATAGNGGGGSSKSKSRGGGAEAITHTKELKTKAIPDQIMPLRAALYDNDGKDKNVLKSLNANFAKYHKNGLDCELEFSHKLTKKEFEWAFELTKGHMEDIYEDSGYGWDDDEKRDDLREEGARFIIARNNENGQPIAFVHFRFTVQGELIQKMAGETTIYVWDLHVEDEIQRKGLGSHLMMVIELIALYEKMQNVSFPVQQSDDIGNSFISKRKGYSKDLWLSTIGGFDDKEEGFVVLTKTMGKRPMKQVTAPVNTEKVVEDTAEAAAPANKNVFGFQAPSTSTPTKVKNESMTTSSPTGVMDMDAPIEESSKSKGDNTDTLDEAVNKLAL